MRTSARRSRIGVVLGLAVATPAALALTPAPEEVGALSPLCQAVFGKGGTRNERLAPFANMLKGSCGIIHTCGAEVAMLRYRKLPASGGTPRQQTAKKGLLTEAIGNLGYEIRCAPETYPLLPQIYTDRARAHMLAGHRADAMKDVQRAADLRRTIPQAQTMPVVPPAGNAGAVPLPPLPVRPDQPSSTANVPTASAQPAAATSSVPVGADEGGRLAGGWTPSSPSSATRGGRTIEGN